MLARCDSWDYASSVVAKPMMGSPGIRGVHTMQHMGSFSNQLCAWEERNGIPEIGKAGNHGAPNTQRKRSERAPLS
jgi:hypothetical protein